MSSNITRIQLTAQQLFALSNSHPDGATNIEISIREGTPDLIVGFYNEMDGDILGYMLRTVSIEPDGSTVTRWERT